MTDLLLLGLDTAPARELAAGLGTDLTVVARLPAVAAWDWSFTAGVDAAVAAIDALPRSERVVVCTWGDDYEARPLVDVAGDEWTNRVEQPMALWYAVLGAAADRCADGGALAVVVERPALLDSYGHTMACAVAEGILALVRSMSLVHGRRGVRVNAVGTAVASAPEVLLGHAPALDGFPGSAAREVAGAVRMVLSDDACGVSGTLVSASGGRV